MPSSAPLRIEDPVRLGGYDLRGRLGEGGQGVVYLATDSSGGHVAIKWLRSELSGDQVSIERFLREVQAAEQVAPFCTAQVLATGVEYERPFIVSEFIDGPSLQRVVHDEGPRTGSSLYRLAIGTATALAAIHQAGIVHRDFKPANVIVAADGPRVIDFGIARALNATTTISSMPVGTPAYMPPEQILGHTVGAEADLFSWASTMVYAASGRSPFGSDTMPAVINRVLNQEPDLSGLDGPLLEVVLSCLAKDPSRRPSAEQVILRLLQHPVPASGMLKEGAQAASTPGMAGPPSYPGPPPPAGPPSQPATWPQPHPQQGQWGPPSPQQGPWVPQGQQPWGPPAPMPYGQPHYAQQQPPSPKKSRTGLIVGAAAAFAVVLIAGIAFLLPWGRTIDTAGPSYTTQATPTREPTPTATPIPTTGLKGVTLLGGGTVFEHPTDPITLTSYEIFDKKADEWIDYARGSLRGTFARYKENWETVLSPDGRYLVSRGKSYTSDDFDSIVITNRDTGVKSTIKTVKEPLISSIRSWSRDGSKILLNIERSKNGGWTYPGFVIVDVASGKAEVVNVDDEAIRTTAFGWDSQDDGVINAFTSGGKKGLRFFGSDGKAVRDAGNVGVLPRGTMDLFSPSGATFYTNCPGGGDGDHCVWDSETGKELRRFSSGCDKALGWWDETHLYCWELDSGSKDRVQVVDFEGRAVRTIIEIPGGTDLSPAFSRKLS